MFPESMVVRLFQKSGVIVTFFLGFDIPSRVFKKAFILKDLEGFYVIGFENPFIVGKGFYSFNLSRFCDIQSFVIFSGLIIIFRLEK